MRDSELEEPLTPSLFSLVRCAMMILLLLFPNIRIFYKKKKKWRKLSSNKELQWHDLFLSLFIDTTFNNRFLNFFSLLYINSFTVYFSKTLISLSNKYSRVLTKQLCFINSIVTFLDHFQQTCLSQTKKKKTLQRATLENFPLTSFFFLLSTRTKEKKN